ncbi:hypothetical protein T265_06222 [Opisthorchis viverrini]|uniref:Uncharacterized protein n=1 Tax=Opisthorchis viverrini TaxID=6198 RepID=A0A075AE95_OPIVI|nr:hypothetical protein T265_06222 [Opisthorchis viverrini]KER26579.1 hypothetical protein T265_06222 [Opisthorchis viverrini]
MDDADDNPELVILTSIFDDDSDSRLFGTMNDAGLPGSETMWQIDDARLPFPGIATTEIRQQMPTPRPTWVVVQSTSFVHRIITRLNITLANTVLGLSGE